MLIGITCYQYTMFKQMANLMQIWVEARLGYPLENTRNSLLKIQIHFPRLYLQKEKQVQGFIKNVF